MRVVNTNSRVEEGLGKRLLETLGKEGVSIIEAYMIKKGKECEAYVFEAITTHNDIELEVAMDESTADSRVKTFSTLVPEGRL